MCRPCVGLMVAAFACALGGGVANATHNIPKDAKQLKGEFVKSIAECSSPSSSTSNGFPTCPGVVDLDPTCTFTSKGKGKFLLRYSAKGPDGIAGTADDGDMDVQATLVGLDVVGCGAQTLDLTLTMRMGTDDCGGPCTVTDFSLAVASCTVDVVGACKLKTTVNTELPGVLLNGTHLAIAIQRVAMMNGSSRTFEAGILVK